MIKNDFGLFQSVHGFFFFQLDSLHALRYGRFFKQSASVLQKKERKSYRFGKT